MFYLNQPHSYTSQGRLICRIVVVVGAPSFLALNNNIAEQHFWLLQPEFGHNNKLLNIYKYILFQSNSFLHLSGKAYLQEF